jgi:hypothetical protein
MVANHYCIRQGTCEYMKSAQYRIVDCSGNVAQGLEMDFADLLD